MSRRLHFYIRVVMSVFYEDTRKIESRFWDRVDKSGECWEWQTGTTQDGYGKTQFRIDGKKTCMRAHRVALSLKTKADLSSSDIVRHTCDNRVCVNPHHLEVGTHQDNVNDRVLRGRSASGENNGRSKLSVDQVENIRRDFREFLCEKSKDLGVSPKTIRGICKGKVWSKVEEGSNLF